MNRLLNNWVLKVTSLVIAIALWGHVRGEVNPWEDATFRVKMQAPLPSANMMLLNAKDIPSVVQVKVTAPRLRLREIKGVTPPNPLAPAGEAPLLSAAQMHATLDFSLVKPGKQTVPVKIVSSLEGVEDLLPKPSDITLEFAPAASAELKIEPQFSPEALRNYLVENVSLVPQQARVFGPAKSIAHVAHLHARLETPDQLSGELSVKAAPLVSVDKNGKVLDDVRVSPETAAVSAMLRERIAQKSVKLSLKVEGAPASGFVLEKQELSAATIVVQGPRGVLKDLKEISARVSVAGANAPLQKAVRIELPRGIQRIRKGEITARVQIVPKETSTTTPTTQPLAESTSTAQPTATLALPAPATP